MQTRLHIAQVAAEKLAATSPFSAMVGFDGFIDEIISVVDQRSDMSAAGYSRLNTIGQFAARAAAAAGKSTNMELVVNEERWGGNGPLMAGALGSLGAKVTYIGAVGKVEKPTELHPLYAEMAARCEKVIPVAPPALTHAFEFEDGKIMFGKTANVQRVTWEQIVATVGLEQMRAIVSGSRLIGIVNWTMLGGVEGIWEGLCRDVLSQDPSLSHTLRIFVDLSDPAKRTDADILRCFETLGRLSIFVPVTLGLNLAEAERVAAVLGIRCFGDCAAKISIAVRQAAAMIREAAKLDCVVIHPRQGAGAATANATGWFDGPFTSQPKLSTGAGDHFNGGFAFAQALGLSLDECLAVGCAVSGVYVRDAKSPTLARLTEFLRVLPDPQH